MFTFVMMVISAVVGFFITKTVLEMGKNKTSTVNTENKVNDMQDLKNMASTYTEQHVKAPITELRFVTIAQAEMCSNHSPVFMDTAPEHSIKYLYNQKDKDIYLLKNEYGTKCMLVDTEDISIYFQLYIEEFINQAALESINTQETMEISTEGYAPELFVSVADEGIPKLAEFDDNMLYSLYKKKDNDKVYCLNVVDKKSSMLYVYIGVAVDVVEYN